jgi:uncharacterized protein
MIVKNIFGASALLLLSFGSCTNTSKPNAESQMHDAAVDTLVNNKSQNMNNYISMFEIPATDLGRAIDFYQSILSIKIDKMDMPGMQMGILPYENQAVTGIIIKAEGYKPSADGTTIYLNGGENLQTILDKVEKNGGKVINSKTAHADGNGFFAIFLDSEGNKLGLNSPK